MQVRVLAFAVLRDRLGFAERDLELPAGATVADAAAALFGGAPPRGVAFAVNQVHAAPARVLASGDELALLPPVSGGAPLLRIQQEPIDATALIAATADDSCGAVLVFLGTARELAGERLTRLEYEAYPEMAERFFAEVADEVRDQHGVERIAIVHRTGALGVGETSVAIVVASAHRAPGFAALRHAIERIKEAAPIWKKEVTERGSHWMESERMGS